MIVVDTGVLYAGADRDDRHHRACAELLATHPGPLLVPVPVIVESAWLIEARLGPGPEAAFLRSLSAVGLSRVDLVQADWDRVVELIETYHDLGLGLVDASVIAVAERLGITEIATLDRRHFTVVRPRHTDALELIP